MEHICNKLIHIPSLKISYFQLKNSNIIYIEDIDINQIYQIIHFICTYIELMYVIENRMKNNIAYIIGSGNTGTWNGTGENGWLYSISIQ